MYKISESLINDEDFALPYQKKKSRDKISSVKNFVTGKIIRHFLQTNFFAWLSENINWIKKTLISHLDHSLVC